MRKITLLILIVLIQGHIYAQTMAQLVKNKATSTCNCFEDIDYIDSEVDFELKMDSCSLLNKKDSLKIKKLGGINRYKYEFYDYLQTNCDVYINKLNDLSLSYTNENNTPFSIEESLSSNNQKIIGEYSLAFGNHQPEGSGHLFVLKDNMYLITYFGGAQAGRWKIVNDKYLHFIPLRPKQPYAIYGRYNPSIKDSSKIVFKGREFRTTFIYFGNTEKHRVNLTPILNKDANCLNYPIKTSVKNIHNEISLAYYNRWSDSKENFKIELFSFQNPNKYNDFLVYEYLKNYQLKPFRVIIDGDNLIFEKNRITTRQPLKEYSSNEGYDFLLKKISIDNSIQKYYNLGFKEFKEILIMDKKHYTYNSINNTYISTSPDCKTIDGKDCYKASDYDNVKVVNKYDVLQNITLSIKLINFIDKPLIYSICD